MNREDIKTLVEYKELVESSRNKRKGWDIAIPLLLIVSGLIKIISFYYFKGQLLASNPSISQMISFTLEWAYLPAVGVLFIIIGGIALMGQSQKSIEQNVSLVLVEELLRRHEQ